MHKDKPGALFSYKGHSLMADEFHAAVCGTLGLIIGASESTSRAIIEEFPYFLASLLVSYAIGRYFRK